MNFIRAAIRIAAETLVSGLLRLMPARLQLIVRKRSEMTTPLDYAHGKLRIVVDSSTELLLRARSCEKEPELVKWMETQFRDGDVFYDVGANIGAYSLVAASLPKKSIRVLAFEPSALNYSQLARNIRLNDLGDRISAYQIALSDTLEILTFNYSSLEPGWSQHEVSRSVKAGAGYSQPVIGVPIAWACEHLGFPIPNHLKIDVDGGEQGVINGLAPLLPNSTIRTILIELDEDEGAIKSQLTSAGFRLEGVYPPDPKWTNGQQIRTSNHIFIR